MTKTRSNTTHPTRPAARPLPGTTRPTNTRRNAAIAAAVVAALTGIAGAFLLLGGGGDDDAEYTCGGNRLIALDLSSQNRGEQQVQLATDVIAGHAFGAAVCDEHLTIVGVAAATPVRIDVEDALPELVGPNARARAQVARQHLEAIQSAAADAVSGVFEQFPEVATTSVPALYDAVAAHAEPGDRIVLVTTGVHDESALTLNRPLAEGEGKDIAKSMSWPTLPNDATVSVLGVGQMDTDVPAPGVLWPREVVAFNEAACAATTARQCDVLQVASSSEAQL